MSQVELPIETPESAEQPASEAPARSSTRRAWLSASLFWDVLLIVALLAGAFYRFNGQAWDEFSWMHPDERFLIWVTNDLIQVEGPDAYFDTATSTLNPHNRGFGFFVYGTFPLFLTRYLSDAIYEFVGWEEIAVIGRSLSAIFDWLTIALVYVIAGRLFGRRVGALAALFLAGAALPIQLAHFYKEDTFLNFFMLLAVALAMQMLPGKDDDAEAWQDWKPWRAWPLVLAFGIALGLATASKLNAAPVAIVLPLAVGLRVWRLPSTRRNAVLIPALVLLVIGAAASLATFRLAQPYAFSGPSVLNVWPNQAWVDDIIEQRNQAAGDVDYPPSLQWARRPLTFAWENMIVWGLGLPLGLLALAGLIATGVHLLLRRPWDGRAGVFAWALLYLLWQSTQFNPTMRYLLPAYPFMAIFAAWLVWAAWDAARKLPAGWVRPARIAWGALALTVLAATHVYATAFSQIYTRPFTRAEASRWIYENVLGPINLNIAGDENLSQPVPYYPYDYAIRPELPYVTSFQPRTGGLLESIQLPDVRSEQFTLGETALALRFLTNFEDEVPLGLGTLIVNQQQLAELNGQAFFLLDRPIEVQAGQTLALALEPLDATASIPLSAVLHLSLDVNGQMVELTYPFEDQQISFNTPWTQFVPIDSNAQIISAWLKLPVWSAPSTPGETQTLVAEVRPSDDSQPAVTARLSADFSQARQPGSDGYRMIFDTPLVLETGKTYQLILSLDAPPGSAVTLQGQGLANEGDWDDGLPLRMMGYDGFGGLYPQELNFNMYWDDNQDKLDRFQRILDEAEYVVISSNRQWGVLPRLPERFPLVTEYYRSLLGCPDDQTIFWCYSVAEPGMFEGQLGYELVETFTSEPQIGPWTINTQFGEEAFSVYDHPKVFIFRKTAAYDPAVTANILGSVDLSRVIHVTPKQASARQLDLMLPEQRLAQQQAGGTYSDLFPADWLLNQQPWLAAIVWYVSIGLLGWAVFPWVRRAMPGLADQGYPLARLAGMLLFAYLAWLLASIGLTYTRPILMGIALGLLVLGGLGIYLQRSELAELWSTRKADLLLIEVLALASFLLVLGIRIGNPDLWHPWKGGEKPMDFSYFNAVLRSTTFPPYDPWFAGGYINYYYFGFVLVGTPVKLLGIDPAIAYNLILPTLYSLIALGAYSAGYNLVARLRPSITSGWRDLLKPLERRAGLMAAAAVALLGNLGTLRMILRGYQLLASPGVDLDSANLIDRLLWTMQGFVRVLTGADVPYPVADWYWIPSRAIPALGDTEPITEFPFFTIVYADLHAHLIALPLTLLALVWAIAVIRSGARWHSWWSAAGGFLLGALAVGALRPTNTWDWPTYLVLAMLALVYAAWRGRAGGGWRDWLQQRGVNLSEPVLALIVGAGGALLLAGLSTLLFQPYAYWYGQGYDSIEWWMGPRTPLNAYFLHWGVFLFVIFAWLVSETVDWLKSIPASSLLKLAPYRDWLISLGVMVVLVMAALGLTLPGMEEIPLGKGIQVAWLVIPLGVWTVILLLRPGLSDLRKAALFLVGSGLALTLVVEIVRLEGDIGRMNTVFKFYYQVWTLFGVVAAASLAWLLPRLPRWPSALRSAWLLVLTMLIAAALMYPLTASTAKIEDRMAMDAPSGLDGLVYMQYAETYDQDRPLTLDEDYAAIQWLQENVAGSPVIVEANIPEYRWGSRITINTGLPGVVGWNWHQRQQRGTVTPSIWVEQRVAEVTTFYMTPDIEAALDFLRKYDVRYIIVGQLEDAYYHGEGLQKFPEYAGVYWQPVFQQGETVIYEVLPQVLGLAGQANPALSAP